MQHSHSGLVPEEELILLGSIETQLKTFFIALPIFPEQIGESGSKNFLGIVRGTLSTVQFEFHIIFKIILKTIKTSPFLNSLKEEGRENYCAFMVPYFTNMTNVHTQHRHLVCLCSLTE